jgi:hypothetical protein
MKYKVCTACGVNKPYSEYHKRPERPIGIKPRCKDCCSQSRKNHYEKEKQSGRLRETIWARQDINITYDEYLAKYNYLDGKCEICHLEFDVLCVDHNHKTGEIRGLLCTRCNLGIDNMNESVAVMTRAIQYIQLYGGIHD